MRIKKSPKLNQSGFSHIELGLAVVVIVIVGVVGVYVSKNNSSHAITPSSLAAQRPTSWMLNNGAYTQLESANISSSTLSTLFNHSSTYYLSAAAESPFPQATSTETFTSYAAFSTAVANNNIGSNVKAIVYDNEDWSYTPTNEQENPVDYAKRAAKLAHQHDWQLIFTPSTDLVNVLAPGSPKAYPAFLSLDILGGAAPYVDVIEIQGQGSEGTPEYATFVQEAVQQIDQGKHGKIFAGMSSDPSGNPVSAVGLENDYNATKKYVNGYWLNIPVQSSYCPKCGDGNPQAAKAFLHSLVEK